MIALEDVVNLTPHDVVLYKPDRKTVLATFPRSGNVARVVFHAPSVTTASYNGTELPIAIGRLNPTFVAIDFGHPPPPKSALIVSEVTAKGLLMTAADGDGPVLSPDTDPETVVRDDHGRIIGVTRLILWHPKL